MRCSDAIELFTRHQDGDLSPGVRRELEAHLATCARCRDEFAAVEAALAAVHRLSPEAPPPGLASAVRARLHQRVERPRTVLVRWAVPVGAAAVLVMVTFGIMRVMPGSRLGRVPAMAVRTPSVQQPAGAVSPASHPAATRRAQYSKELAPAPGRLGEVASDREAKVPATPIPLSRASFGKALRATTGPPPPAARGTVAGAPAGGPQSKRERMVAALPMNVAPAPAASSPAAASVPAGGAVGSRAARESRLRHTFAERGAIAGAERPSPSPAAVQPLAAAPSSETAAPKTKAEGAFDRMREITRPAAPASMTVTAQASRTQVAGRSLTVELRPNEEVDDARVALRSPGTSAPETIVWQGRLKKDAVNSVDVQIAPAAAGASQQLVISGSRLSPQAYHVFAPTPQTGDRAEGLASQAGKPARSRKPAANTWQDALQAMASQRGTYVLAPTDFPVGTLVNLGSQPTQRVVETALRQIGYELRSEPGVLVVESAPQAPGTPQPGRRWRQ